MWVGGERHRSRRRRGQRSGQRARRRALRQAIGDRYPQLVEVHLTDFKVRVLDTAQGHGRGHPRALDSTNGERSWSTIGVSENIIEASWQALVDSIASSGCCTRQTGGSLPG